MKIDVLYPYLKGRSCRLKPNAHILDDSLGNPYDVFKVLSEKRAISLQKKEPGKGKGVALFSGGRWIFFPEEDGSFFGVA